MLLKGILDLVLEDEVEVVLDPGSGGFFVEVQELFFFFGGEVIVEEEFVV